MKSLQEIYSDIRSKFYKSTGIDVERGTTIDYFMLASAEMLEQAHKEIEDNKTPHVFSNLSGSRIDDMAMLCGLTRKADESDRNFLYRLLKWNISNKASNLTAIETALMDLNNCSHVTYVPHTFGCGTATAYIIPKSMDDVTKELAIAETKSALSEVVSPSTFVEYMIPEIREVRMTCLYKATALDKSAIQKNISNKIIEYVNGVEPGQCLEVGYINRIGITEPNVEYFNIANLSINGEEIGDVSILQKVDSKLITSADNMIWMEVE